jgi:hypothetical protein
VLHGQVSVQGSALFPSQFKIQCRAIVTDAAWFTLVRSNDCRSQLSIVPIHGDFKAAARPQTGSPYRTDFSDFLSARYSAGRCDRNEFERGDNRPSIKLVVAANQARRELKPDPAGLHIQRYR